MRVSFFRTAIFGAVILLMSNGVSAQTVYTTSGNVDNSNSVVKKQSTVVYASTEEDLVSGGSGFTVGDYVVDDATGSVFRVTGVTTGTDSSGNSVTGVISSLAVAWYGANVADLTGQTEKLIPDVTDNTNQTLAGTSPSTTQPTNASIKIISTQKMDIGANPISLQDKFNGEYDPRDYGVKLDGSQDDLANFARFYAIVPDRGVIKFPCGAKLPPFPTTSSHVGIHNAGKSVTWDLTCAGVWGGTAAVDNDLADRDLIKMNISGGEWWRRNNTNDGDQFPILSTLVNYRGGGSGAYASGEFGQVNSFSIGSNAFHNAKYTVQTLLVQANDYEQAKWDDQNTGYMEYAEMHNDSSFWPFVVQMTDTSGAQARGWTLTDEYDVGGNGRDFGTDWRRPDDETYAIEPYYAPLDSARKVIAFLPGSVHPDGVSQWQPFHYYNVGDRVYTPNNDSIMVAKTAGYSGAYEPNLTGIQPLDDGTSVHPYEAQESGDLSAIPTAVPHDTYFTVGNVFKLKATDGNAYYYWVSTSPGPNDSNQVNQTMGSLFDTGVNALMSKLKPYTVFVPHDNVTSPSCDDVYTCYAGFTFIPVDPATITAVTKAYNSGTNSQMVTWDKTNTRTEEIGLGIDFQGEYGTPYGRYHNFDPIWVTPISGQARLINAFLDASWMIDWAKTTATIRMHAGQKIDFDANGTEAGKNRHTLSYSSSDSAMEFRTSSGSSDPTAFTDSPTYIFGDDGTIHLANPWGMSRVVTTHGNDANNISFDFTYPVITAYTDSVFMGYIPHDHGSTPDNTAVDCTVGEYHDTLAAHYSCIAPNTWAKTSWVPVSVEGLSAIAAETHTEGDRAWCHDCRAPGEAIGKGTGRWIYLNSKSVWKTEDGLDASN